MKELPKLRLIVCFGTIKGLELFLRKVVTISKSIALNGVSGDLLGSGFLCRQDHLRYRGMKGVETLIAFRLINLALVSFVEPAFCLLLRPFK